MSSSKPVSIIIPTYERARVLDRVIPAYLRSDQVGELLIVDDGSQDQTAQIIDVHRRKDSRVKKHTHETNLGRTFARNTGIKHATGDLVLFAKPGYDWSDHNRGGHGGLHAGEMCVPMLIAGPQVKPGTMSGVRTVDWVPTMIEHFGQQRGSLPAVRWDGRSFYGALGVKR